jgi:very-short-patch-repair endonuclease
MRFEATPSEQALWSALRGKRLLGVAFKRQVPIGRYVVDFLAPSRHVVVEVDGGYHARRLRGDARRDAWLRREGYRVVRLEAEMVLSDLAGALARITEEVTGNE